MKLSEINQRQISTRMFCYLTLVFILIGINNNVLAQTPVILLSDDTEPVYIKEWLLAGPFPSVDLKLPLDQGPYREGYSTDYLVSLGGESNAKIEEGTVVSIKDGKKIKFSAYSSQEDYIDLTDALGQLSNVCAYIYTELESESEQTVSLHIGTNDAGKMWVDGKLVSFYTGDRKAQRSQHTAEVKLIPGRRIPILLKIDQGGGGWGALVEVYGRSAHKKFMEGRIENKFDIASDNPFPAVGETVNARILKYQTSDWFELDVDVKWTLEDRGIQIPLNDNLDKISFSIPDGPARILYLQATKQVGSKKIEGTLGIMTRRKDIIEIAEENGILNIGDRLELFVDHYLINKLIDTKLVLHEPKDEGEVLRLDEPWEGLFCGYFTIIKDDNKYYMYYRGRSELGYDGNPNEVTCYAVSHDGINWKKPNVGEYKVKGSYNNNIILANAPPFNHNFCPFVDTNPEVSPKEKFKAVAGTMESGLFGFISEDGIHWKKISQKPIFTRGVFDSQNVVFWSQSENLYVCYFRTWTGPEYSGIRTISRTTSKDFLHWSDPEKMNFGHTPTEHLYTNQTSPYFRAPHIYVAIAARFMPNRQVISDDQALHLNVDPRYFKDCSDAIFMTSRGGNKYDRTFMEGFIRPGIGLQNWISRTNYPALNVVQTSPVEMSIYVQKDYAQPTAHLRRYSLRLDGFTSLRASNIVGEMITKPFSFKGKELVLNFSTSAAGFIKVEILDEQGSIIPGYELENSQEIIGNEIERTVTWQANPDMKKLNDKPVRLRFVMKDADLYSMKFRKKSINN